MVVVEHSFSEFLRKPNDVVAGLTDSDVVLRRRNAPALRLSQADRDDDRIEAFETLAKLLRNLAAHSPQIVETVVVDVFEWTVFLPDNDKKLFVDELTKMLVAAASLNNYSPVAQLLRESKATAEIHADPKLSHRLNKDIDNPDGSAVTVEG